MLPRSGSNFLAQLLEIHPDCVVSSIPEDWLLAESRILSRYATAVARRWSFYPRWKIGPDTREDLVRHLGDALISFLHAQTRGANDKRLISKTPAVKTLSNFFQLFPGAYLLILVRDGRSVVESSFRSFNFPRKRVTRWWKSAAEDVLEFDRENRESGLQYRIVRYEDLLCNFSKEMMDILQFLDLDPRLYDFSRSENLPVLGSSSTTDDSGDWTWKISHGSGNLGSLERWSGWERGQHEHFNWIASKELEALGYQTRVFSGRHLVWRCIKLSWFLEDVLRQTYWRLAGLIKPER